MERAVRFPMRLFPPALAFLTACAISAGSVAAYKSTTTNSGDAVSAGSVSLFDNDSGSAMFSPSNLKPGDSYSSCIQVSYTGTLPALVKLYGPPAARVWRPTWT